MIKVPLPPQDQSTFNNTLFEKECEFYSKVCPKIKILLKELNEEQKFLPEIIGILENNTILMEDLSIDGYGVTSKFRGLNHSEAKDVLRKAAILHATCAVLQEQQPNIFENFQHGKKTCF